MEPTLDRKLKKRRMGSPEGRDDKIRGGRPGVRGLKGRERPVQTNEEVKRKMRHQNYLDRISSPTAGYMTGGQAKIAAKAPPPNKIDAKDFAVLRAEKAKGRGQGLQDEKLKPGKVMKASTGREVQGPRSGLGLTPGKANRMTPEGAKKAKEKFLMDRFKKKRKEQSDKPMIPLGRKIKKPKPGSYEYQQQQTQNTRPSQILPKKKMGGVMKYDKGGMGEAKGYKKYLEGLKKSEGSVFRSKYRAKEIAKAGGKAALRAAKASRIGKIALGVAAVGLGAKEFLKRKLEKRKRIQKEKTAVRTLKEDMAVQKLKEGLPKKMGGGMMQRPIMGYESGSKKAVSIKIAQRQKVKDRITSRDYKNAKKEATKAMGGYMGGGMMQRPIMGGYKTGKMIKARGCKLGRSKPTKLY